MEITWDEVFDRLIGHEGGYVNNPSDPGGETNWGISKRQYLNVDIKNLTRDQAKDIYKRDYWDRCGNILSNAMKFQMFDAAVNHGLPNAIRMLQNAGGCAPDGHWGAISTAAYRSMKDHDVAMRFLAQRLDFMRKLSTFKVFGAGWCGRIVSNLIYASTDID
jgi:lysozyme family protein